MREQLLVNKMVGLSLSESDNLSLREFKMSVSLAKEIYKAFPKNPFG